MGASENLVIVGSGPAGYTAAIYAARANLNPLLITGFQRGGIPGGQLMTTTHVENFPGFPDGVLGPDLMDLMKAQAERWGTHLIEADADVIDLSQRPYRIQAEGKTIETQSIIIATGASANRLGLPNEDRFWSQEIPLARKRSISPSTAVMCTSWCAQTACAPVRLWLTALKPIPKSRCIGTRRLWTLKERTG